MEGFNSDLSTPPPAPASAVEGFDAELRAFDDEAYKTNLGYTKEQTDTWREPRFAYPTENQTSDAFQKIARSVDSPLDERITAVGQFYDDTMSGLIKNAPNASRRAKGAGKLEADYGAAKSDLFHQFSHQRIKELFPDHTERTGFIEELNSKGFASLQNSESPKHKAAYTDLTQGFDKLLPAKDMIRGGEISNKDGTKIAEFNTNRLNNGNTVISLRFPSVDANGNPGLFDKDNILEMPYPTADDVSAEVKRLRDEAAAARKMADDFLKPDTSVMAPGSRYDVSSATKVMGYSEGMAFKKDAERLAAEANSLAIGGPDALLERRIEEKVRTDKNLLSQVYSPGFMQEAGTALDKFIISAAATADSTPYWKEFTSGLTGVLGAGAEAVGLDPTEYGLYEGGSVVSRAPDVIKTIDETRPGMAQTQFEGGMANNVMLGAVENWPQIAAQTAMVAAAGGPAMLFGRLPGMLAARTASMAPIAVTVPGQGMVEVEGRAQDIEGGYNAQIRSLELAYQKLDSIKEVADLSKQIAQIETEFPDSPELDGMRNELALLKQSKAVEIETKIAGLREKSKAEAIKMRDKAVGYSLTNLAIELGSEMIFPNSQVRLAKGIGRARGLITDIGKEAAEEPIAGFGQDLFANPILGEFNHPLDPEKRITEGLVGGIMAGGQVTIQKGVNRGMFGSQEQQERKAASKAAAKAMALVQNIQGGTAPVPLDTKSEFVDGPLGVQTKNPHYVSQDSNGKWGIADDEWKAKAAAIGLPTEFDTEDEAAAMAQTRYQNLFKESVERTVGGDATERRNAIMASADIILKMASVTGAGNLGFTAEDLFRMIVVQEVPQNNRPKDMPGANPWVTAANIPAPGAPTPVKGSPPATGTGTPPATGTPPVTDTGAGTTPATGTGLTPSPNTIANPWTTATVPLPANPPTTTPPTTTTPTSGVAPTETGGAAPTMTPDEEIQSINTQMGGLTAKLYDLIEESKRLMDSGAGLEELIAVANKRGEINEEQKALAARLKELMDAKGKVVPAVDVSTAKPTNTIPSVDDSNAAKKKDAEDQEDANGKVQAGVESNNVETDQEENNKKAGVPEIEVILESTDNGFAKTVGAKIAETLKHPLVQRLYALGKANVVVGTPAQILAKYGVDVIGSRAVASAQDATGGASTTIYVNLDAADGIMDGLDMTIIHEGVHAVEFAFRQTKMGRSLYLLAVKEFQKGHTNFSKTLDNRMRVEYYGWDNLSNQGKFAETVRAIMSGRIFGDNLTAGNPTTSNNPSFKKYIKGFVKYIKTLFSDGPPSGTLAVYVQNLENFVNEYDPNNPDASLDPIQPGQAPQPMAASESTADIIEETTKAAVIPGRRVGTSSPTSPKTESNGANPDHNVTLDRLKREKPEFYRRNAVLLGAYPIVANVGGKAFAKMRKDLISLYEVSAKLVTQREENNAVRKQIGKIITDAAKAKATAEGRPRGDVKAASKEEIDNFIANPTKGNVAIAKKAASSQAALDKAIGREKALKDITSEEITKLSRDPKRFSMEEAEAVYDSYIEQTQKNLEMLIELMPDSIRKVAKLWYDGANRIANAFAGNYDVTVEQSAAVLAVFSPQKDWFMNVSLANRMMDVWKNKQNHIWDADMSTQFRKRMGEPQIKMSKGPDGTLIESRKDEPSKEDLVKNNRGEALNPEGYIYVGGAKPVGFDEDGNKIWENFTSETKAMQRKTAEDFIKKAQGKLSLSQMTDLEQGWFIRMYSETYHPETYEVVGPDGSFGNKAKTGDGKRDLRIAWGGYSTIAKAISVMENGDQAAISSALGSQHKVRSFYNNIVDPSEATTLGDTNLYGDVTMDTHAVAALLLLPLSGATREVSQNFGGGGASSDSVAGLNGMYAANAEAYRRAAKDFGLLPREVQSITWEAVRMLFPASWKSNKKNVAAARSIWNDYANGDITADTARSRIWELSPASAGATKRDGTAGNRVGLAAAKKNGRGVGSPEWWEAVVPGGEEGPGDGELTDKGWTPEIGGFRDGRGRRGRNAGRANRGRNNSSLLADASERISNWGKNPTVPEPQKQAESSESNILSRMGPSRQAARAGDVTVMVDVQKMDADWSKDPSSYIGQDGSGQIRDRINGFKKYLETGKPIGQSEVGLGPGGTVAFTNGRHRFAVMRDMGMTEIPVSVNKGSAQKFQELYGVSEAQEESSTPSIMRQTEAGTEADFEIPGWVNTIYKDSLNPSIAPVAAVMNFTEASTFADVIHQFTHVLSILQVYVDPTNQAAGKRTLLESMLGSKFLSLYNFATQDGRIDPSTPEGFRSYLERISEGMVRFIADGDVPSTADKKLVDGFTVMRDGLKKVIASYQATGIPFGVSLPDKEALTDDVLNAYQEIMFNIWVSEKRSQLPPETLTDMEAANAMHLAALEQLDVSVPANLYQPAQTVAFKELSPMVTVANLLIAQKNKGISPKSFSDFQAMIDPSSPLAQLTEGQLQIVYQVASISAPNPVEKAIHDKIKALMAVPLTTLAADAKVTTDLIQEAIDAETDPVSRAKLETIIYQADTANTHAQLAAAQARAAHAIASSIAAKNRRVADKMRSMMAGHRAGKADSSIQELGEEVKRVFAIYAKSMKLKKGTKAMVRQMIDGATLMQKGKISPADFMALIAGATQAVEQDIYAASVIAFNKGVVTGTKATVADVRRRAKMLQDVVIAELATIKTPTKPVVKAVLKALNGVTSTVRLVKAANLIAKSFNSRRTREAYSKAKKLAEATKANINKGMFGVAGSHVATLAGVKTSQIPQTMLGSYLSLVSYLGQKSREIVVDPTILGAIDLWNSTFEAHITANPPVGRGVSAGAASARAAAEAAKKAQAMIDYDAARKTVSRDAFVDAYTKLYGKTKEQALSAIETLEKWLPFLENAESVDLDHLNSKQINGLISSFAAFNNGIIQAQLILAGQEIATRETHETLLPVIQQAIRHVLGADPSITLAGITPNELESRSKSIASTMLLFAHSGKYSKEDFRKTLQKVGLSHFDTLFGTVSSMAELIVSPLTKLHFEGEMRKQRMLEAGNLYVDAKDHESETAIKPEMLEAMTKSGLLDVSLWQGNTSFFAPVAAAVGGIGRILVPPARRHYRREAISRILGIAMIQRQREANGWSDPNAATIDDNYILWLTTSKPGDVSSEYGRREGVRQQRAAAAIISALNGAAPTWANIEKLLSAKNLEAVKNADTVFEQTGETVHYLNMMDEAKPLRTFDKYFPINDMSGKTADLSSGAKLASKSMMPQPGSVSPQAGSRNQRTDERLKLVDADFFGVVKSHVAEVTGDAAMSPFLSRMNEAMNRIRRSGVVGGVGSSIVEDIQDQLLDHGNRIAQSIFFDQDIATTLFSVIAGKFKEVPLAKLERPFTEGLASVIRALVSSPKATLAGMGRWWSGTKGFPDKLMFELGSNIAIRQGSMTLEMQFANLNATFAGMLNQDFRLPSPISNIKGAWDAGSKMPTGKGVFGWVQTNRTSRAIKGFTQMLVTAGETYVARPLWYGTFTQSLEQQSGIPWSEDNYTNGAYTQEQISRAQALAETAVSRKFAESTPGTQPTIRLEPLDSKDNTLQAVWRYFQTAFTSYSGAQTRDAKASMQALVDGNAAGYDRRDALANLASVVASYAVNTLLVTSIYQIVGTILSSGNPEEDKRRKKRRDDFFKTVTGQGLEGDAEAFYMKMLARSLFASAMGDQPMLIRMGAAAVLEGGNYLAGQGTTWNGGYDPYKDNITFELPPSANNAMIGITSQLTGNDRRLRGDQDTNVTNISSAYQFFGLLAYGVEMGQSALGSAQNIYADKVKGDPVDSSASMDNLAMFGLLSINMLPAAGNAFGASRPREAAANSAYASRNENRDKRTAEKEARTAVDDGLVAERRERVADLGDNIAEHFDETLKKWGTAKAEMNQYEDDTQNEIMTKALREMMMVDSNKMNETFTRSYREMEALDMGRDFLRSVVRLRDAGFSTMPALTEGSEEANKLRDFEESKFTDGISVYEDYYNESRIMRPSLK